MDRGPWRHNVARKLERIRRELLTLATELEEKKDVRAQNAASSVRWAEIQADTAVRTLGIRSGK